MFSCKFCKISFFTEHLWVTASVSVFHPAFFLPIKITLPTKAQKLPPEVLYEKTVLKILQYSQLCITPLLESLFNKVTGLQACNFIKRRLQHKCFHVKFAKFFRASFFTEHFRWLFVKTADFCMAVCYFEQQRSIKKIESEWYKC